MLYHTIVYEVKVQTSAFQLTSKLDSTRFVFDTFNHVIPYWWMIESQRPRKSFLSLVFCWQRFVIAAMKMKLD